MGGRPSPRLHLGPTLSVTQLRDTIASTCPQQRGRLFRKATESSPDHRRRRALPGFARRRLTQVLNTKGMFRRKKGGKMPLMRSYNVAKLTRSSILETVCFFLLGFPGHADVACCKTPGLPGTSNADRGKTGARENFHPFLSDANVQGYRLEMKDRKMWCDWIAPLSSHVGGVTEGLLCSIAKMFYRFLLRCLE